MAVRQWGLWVGCELKMSKEEKDMLLKKTQEMAARERELGTAVDSLNEMALM